MYRRNTIFVVTFIVALTCNLGSADDCDSKRNCGECLEFSNCAWCESSSGDAYCFDSSDNGQCSEYDDDKVLEFHSRKAVIVASQPLWFESVMEDKSQIRPQYLKETHKIGLHRAINTTFEFEYSIADNAVDIYYLLDLTTFTQHDKRYLVRLGNRIVTTIGKMSKNVRIGFGVIKRSEDQLPKTRFIHLMNLSPDTSYFTALLQNISVTNREIKESNNLALVAQAIVCEKNIGWRHDARRILVVSTNSPRDYLNEGQDQWSVDSNIRCGVDASGYYEMTEQNADVDFQAVMKEANEHSVGLVVAVPSNIYRKHKVYNNSANVVNIVKNDYESIKNRLDMTHNGTGVDVRFFTECNENSPKLESAFEKSWCDNVKKGDVIKFKVMIQLPPAQSYHQFLQTVDIYAADMEIHRLSIAYNVTYHCPCEDCDGGIRADVPIEESPEVTTLSPQQVLNKCAEIKDCVECKMYGSGPLSTEECSRCEFVPLGVPSITDSSDSVTCQGTNADDCEFSYTIRETGGQLLVEAQEEVTCPNKDWNIFGW